MVGTEPSITSPVEPSMVIVSPSPISAPPTAQRLALVVDGEAAGAGYAGPAHAPGDDGGVAGHAASGGEDALGGVHPVDVFGTGLGADQDHLVAALGPILGSVGVEHRLARGCARRGRKALGDDVARRSGIERRVQELVEGRRIDAKDRLLAGDQPFVGHVHRDPECRLAGALARAGLQHPQGAALDRELDVLHVAVMGFERVEDASKLAVHFGSVSSIDGAWRRRARGRRGSDIAACGCRRRRPRPAR
jgi:hypothetical protein